MFAASISTISGHQFPYLKEEFLHGPLPVSSFDPTPVLETERLILRRWQSEDMGPFVAMQSDPEVMRFMKGRMGLMDALMEIETYERCFEEYGYGMWAVCLRETGEFVGTVGIEPFHAPGSARPMPMMSWRLRRQYWGQNYAYEAAVAVLDYVQDHLHLEGIKADVTSENTRSLRLMRRLGLSLYRKAV